MSDYELTPTEKVALAIFCAMMSRADATLDIHPRLGEKQVKTSFMLAETFRAVARETSAATR